MTTPILGIGHVALCVPDLDASVAHATVILGLREVERQNGMVYLTCNEQHHALQLIASDVAAFDHVALQATSLPALEELHTTLQRAGIPLLSETPQEPGLAHALRFLAPSGHQFEVFVPHIPESLLGSSGRRVGYLTSDALYNGPGVRPRRLGHALLKCERVEEMQDFLSNVLGFRLSDRALGGDIVWMRCGPDHHTLNLVRGRNGLHHYAWEVESWADLEKVSDHLMENEQTLLWGPGRHGPGNNLFTYHLDPIGAVVEHFADLLRIDHEASYQPQDWTENPTWINRWGPPPPIDFIEQGVHLFMPHQATA
jgi:catechol-2,3-dioxygenase